MIDRDPTIRERSDGDDEEEKMLKVKVPTRIVLKLHKLRILTGHQISTIAQTALEDWFQEQGILEDEEEEPTALEEGSPDKA